LRYFFVFGAPKSGTTWLQRLLDAHPQVVCSGEGHFIERFAGPMMQIKDDYNKNLALDAELVYQGKPYYSELDDLDLLPLLQAFITKLMHRRMKPDALVIGDKTPVYFEFLDDLLAIFPDAAFLHMVRDPRDVAVSVLYHALRAGYPDAFVTGSPYQIKVLEASAQRWLSAQENFHRFSRAYPTGCLEVRYEDLTATPQAIMRTVFDLLGVSTQARIVDAAITSASFENWSGRARGREDTSSFFRKGVVGDWKAALDGDAADRITDICGAWMRWKRYLPASVNDGPTSETSMTLHFSN
jgi:LPS sulfotransferase NodH